MSDRIKINWEGSLFCHHSLAMVNREFMSSLQAYNLFDIKHVPFEPDQFIPAEESKYSTLHSLQNNPHAEADIYLRHRWPPDFTKPKSGKFVLFQPWEYGSLPLEWRDCMNNVADEVWVYTHYLKKCYMRSGVDEKKIFTIPLGVDPEVFHPDVNTLELLKESVCGRFCFLFNGGVTTRKGVDVLVNAYLSEFTAADPVCLVIKDSAAYVKNMAARIEELSKRDDIAKIVYLNVNIDHYDLPSLYAACDCYVHPYRAEGYGLPIAEALACGKPVIVTGGGACLDFVEPDMAYFVKCSIEYMKEKSVSGIETVDYPFWFSPDMSHLQKVMRYVFNNPHDAHEKGQKAGEIIRQRHTWARGAMVIAERFCELSGRKIGPGLSERKEQMLERAIGLLKENRYAEAAREFTIVLQDYGDNSMCYEGLGLIAFQQKKYSDSFEYLKLANRLSPLEVDIFLNWSEAARHTGAITELKTSLSFLMEKYPDNSELRLLSNELGL